MHRCEQTLRALDAPVWPPSLEHYSGLSDSDPSFRSLILRLRQLHWSIETAPYAALIKKYSKQSKHRAAFTAAVRADHIRYSPPTTTVEEEEEEEDGVSGDDAEAGGHVATVPVSVPDVAGVSVRPNKPVPPCRDPTSSAFRDQGTSTAPDADTLAALYLADPPWEAGRSRGSSRHPTGAATEFLRGGEGRGFPLWGSVSHLSAEESGREEFPLLSAVYNPHSSSSSSSSSCSSCSSSSSSTVLPSDLIDAALIPTPDSVSPPEADDDSAFTTTSSEDSGAATGPTSASASVAGDRDGDILQLASVPDVTEVEAEEARSASEWDVETEAAPVHNSHVPGTVQKYWHSPTLLCQIGLAGKEEESAGSEGKETEEERDTDTLLVAEVALPQLAAPLPLRSSNRVMPLPVVSVLKVDVPAPAKTCLATVKGRAASLTAAFEVEVLDPLKGASQPGPHMTRMSTRTRTQTRSCK